MPSIQAFTIKPLPAVDLSTVTPHEAGASVFAVNFMTIKYTGNKANQLVPEREANILVIN